MSALRWAKLWSILLLISGLVRPAAAVDIQPLKGRAVPMVTWIDDIGHTRRLSEFAGYPVILLPIYTRCRAACVMNADRLKTNVAESAIDLSQVRVLLFSFDATDTPATLAAYRKREHIPLAWHVGTASQPDIDALLEAIGFQAGKAGSEFMHTNLVVFLDARLRVAKWIYGTDYSPRDIDDGLKVATGRSDWIGEHSQWLYALSVFGASILCVMLCNYLLQLRRSPAETRAVVSQTFWR